MVCINCGCNMAGDGITLVLHCENVDISDLCLEPDAEPVYCDYDPYDERGHQG